MKKMILAMMAVALMLQTGCTTSSSSNSTNPSSSSEEDPLLIGKFCFEFKAKGYDKTIELTSSDGIYFEGSESQADYEIMSVSYSKFSGTLSSETDILTVSGTLEIEGYEEEFTQEYKIVREDELQLIYNDNIFYAIACDDGGASTEASNTVESKAKCITVQEGEDLTITCQWSIYSFVTETIYDDSDCKFGCSDQYIVKNTSKIKIQDLFKNEDQMLNLLASKFRQEFDVMKKEDPNCFSGVDFYFPGWQVVTYATREDGLTFSMSTDVPDYCYGPFGSCSFSMSFEELSTLVYEN